MINVVAGTKQNHKKKSFGDFFLLSNFANWQSPLTLSHSQFFTNHFQTWQGRLLPQYLRVQLWRFCLIRYVHNGPLNEPASHGIPGLIFQAKVTKCGTNIWWNRLIDIGSGFYQHHEKILAIFFSHFPTSHIKNHGNRSHVHTFYQIFLNCGKEIYCLKISDKFDYGGSAIFNTCIMDHLMSRPLLAFLESFFKLKWPNLVQM